ncbi:hypothetical protein [Roseinatronobacter ekhonensis]|nr:hypothetical protein [Roseibaca ekhonensis]
MYFAHKQVHSCEPLDISRLPPDHRALLHSLAGEEVMQPDLG